MTRRDDKNLLYIELDGGHRYLANRTDTTIDRLIYRTGATHFGMGSADGAVVSDQPRYEILDIPAQSRVHLEKIDPMEGGLIYFVAETVKWSSGATDEAVDLNMRGRERARSQLGLIDPKYAPGGEAPEDPEPPLETVERPKKKLDKKPGRIIEVDSGEEDD